VHYVNETKFEEVLQKTSPEIDILDTQQNKLEVELSASLAENDEYMFETTHDTNEKMLADVIQEATPETACPNMQENNSEASVDAFTDLTDSTSARRAYGVVDFISQTSGIPLPSGVAVPFLLALLCDALLMSTLLCCFGWMRKLLTRKSGKALRDSATTAKFATMKFCKVEKPVHDDPIEPEIDVELQSRINYIVQAHAGSRRQEKTCEVQAVAQEALNAAKKRQLQQSPCKQDAPWSASKDPWSASRDIASPSPAKSMSNIELQYFAHMSLSAAKERNTPAKSPGSIFDDAPVHISWDAYEEEKPQTRSITQNLQSRFALDDEDEQAHEDESKPKMECKTEEEAGLKPKMECKTEEEAGFDITQIPSPCRRRSLSRATPANSPDLAFGERTSQTNGEMRELEKCIVFPDVAENADWKPHDSQFQASPEARAKQNSDWNIRYQSSTHSSQQHGTWKTHASPAEKGSTPSRKLASRRAKAFEAWGVASPDQYAFAFQ
jgi:hypothetical protein